MISISGHKFRAPKGIGSLIISDNKIPISNNMTPIIFGGQQQYHLRGGTENVPYIAGLAAALREFKSNNSIEKTRFLTDFLVSCLKNCEISDKIHINYHSNKIVNFRIDGISAEALELMLYNDGIYLSAGSACNSGSSEPSYVLSSIGLQKNEALSSIRISLTTCNNEEEISYFIKKLQYDATILLGMH